MKIDSTLHELQINDKIPEDPDLIETNQVQSRNLIQRTSLPLTTTFTGIPKQIDDHESINRKSNNISTKPKPELPIKPQGLSTFTGAETCKAISHHTDLNKISKPDQANGSEIFSAPEGLSLIAGDSVGTFKPNSSILSTDAEQDQSSPAVRKILPIDKSSNTHDHSSVDLTKYAGRSISNGTSPLANETALPPSPDHTKPQQKNSIRSSKSNNVVGNNKRRPDGLDSGACHPVKRIDKNPYNDNGPNPEKEVIIATVGENDDREKAPFMCAGLVVAVAASIFLSCSTLFVKLVHDNNTFEEKMQTVLSRSILVTIFGAITIVTQKSTIKVARDEILINFLRAVFGYGSVLCAYMSYSYISLGDSTALLFLSPLWTSILSHFTLGEPLRWMILLVLPVSLFGTVLIAHPTLLFDVGPDECDWMQIEPSIASDGASAIGFQIQNDTFGNGNDSTISKAVTQCMESFDLSVRWPGVVLAIASSFCLSIVYIVLRFRRSTPVLTTTFWLGVISTIFSLIIACCIGFGKSPTALGYFYLLLNGFLSWLGQCAIQWALYYESASVLSMVRTLDVAISFALSAIFLDDQIYWTSIVGATLICLVVLVIVLSSYMQDRFCAKKRIEEPGTVISSKTYTSTRGFDLDNKKSTAPKSAGA